MIRSVIMQVEFLAHLLNISLAFVRVGYFTYDLQMAIYLI